MKQTRLPRQVQLVQRQIQRWQSPPCPHVPNSSFFNIPPHISLALVTSLLNKTSVVASTLTPIHLLHPRMQLLNTLLTLPFLFQKLFFTHPCMHHEFFRVDFQRIYTIFLAFSLDTRWSGWPFSCLTLPPHLFNWRSPLLYHFLPIRQISFFLSTPSVTLSAAPIKIPSRYPT